MDPIEEQKHVETVAAAVRRWQNEPPLQLPLGRWEAYCLIAVIQLALRHPALGDTIASAITRVGQRLQPMAADTPELQEIIQRGWTAAFDVTDSGQPQVAPQQPEVAPGVPPVDRWRRMIVTATHLTAAQKLIALVLASHATTHSLEARITRSQLAEVSGLSSPDVDRAMNLLFGLGLVSCGRWADQTTGVPLYTLAFPPAPVADAPEARP